MEALPWPTITASSGGWLLLGVLLYGLITGRWIATRRELDAAVTRAERAEANNEKLITTLAETTTTAKLQQAVMSAIDAAVQGRSEDVTP